MENASYYVYLHRRLSDNGVFYVGKGKALRAWSKGSRNPHWHNVVKKHGYKVEVVFEDLTEQESLQVEIDTILEMKYFGCRLTNRTNGGEGVSGLIHSEETRKKLSLKLKGKKPTDETVAKIVSKNTGKKRSDAIRASFRKSQAWRRKPLYCSNGMVFNGIEDAIKWLRNSTEFTKASPSCLCVAATQKENGIAYMLRWTYEKDGLQDRIQKESRFRGAVYCSNGMTFQRMKLAVEWLRSNGFPFATCGKISAVCKGKRLTTYGLKWNYLYD